MIDNHREDPPRFIRGVIADYAMTLLVVVIVAGGWYLAARL